MPAAETSLNQQVRLLYSDHHGWLCQWLRKKLGCAHQAGDLAHDTFIRLLNRGETLSIDEPRAYLTTIAKGLLINWYQRQAMERAWLEALALLPEAEVPSEEQRYLILEALHELDRLLDTLPPMVKRCFLLSQIEGLKYEEIAIQLGASLSSVKRYMRQAFQHCLVNME